MNISNLEQKLLEKKTEKFNKEIDKGVEIIINAIQALYDQDSHSISTGGMAGFRGDHASDIQQYLNKKLNVSTVYRAGDLTKVKNDSRGYVTELPGVIGKALLEQATTEFFTKLQEVQNVLDDIN
ncbi:hypothetical protein [Bacillus atrophaeus]|uniref:hypothetical protein n=1 Tax=Bacillus atrophaeus TaxID=1452 RepID=UPI000779A9D0|nr:hypothetical protein [Bacillus atrophaeus]KYD05345.1 hypothetical protein B4144_1953 [Bacillus atrophaeus]